MDRHAISVGLMISVLAAATGCAPLGPKPAALDRSD